MSLQRGWNGLAWLAIVVVLAGALLVGALGQRGARTPDERVERVAATIKCPTCVGQSVAQSEAPASRDIRADIARRITLGESDDQIRQEMA
ncbi:MAG: cytochrome c-type biogenesis protein CcmH, partial [Ilumatobacteraceae bacterium]